MDNGEVSHPSPSIPALQTGSMAMFWPKDRVIQLRLERVCHTIEFGEWPASRKYKLLPDAAYDSRSSTPAPGTPNATGGGEYSIMDASTAATPVSPSIPNVSSGSSYFPFSFAGISAGIGAASGGNDAMMHMLATAAAEAQKAGSTGQQQQQQQWQQRQEVTM